MVSFRGIVFLFALFALVTVCAQEAPAKESSFMEAAAEAKATAYAAAYSRAYAKAHTSATAKVKALTQQEQHYMDVIGPEGKTKFDNIRRAAGWLFKQARYEEGAAMFTRALELYSDSIKKPLKDFANVAALGNAIQRRERELLAARALQKTSPPEASSPDQAETVFLDFFKSVEMRSG